MVSMGSAPTLARIWFDHHFIRIGKGWADCHRTGNAQKENRQLAILQSSAMSRHWQRAKPAWPSIRSGQYPIQKKSGRNAFQELVQHPFCNFPEH